MSALNRFRIDLLMGRLGRAPDFFLERRLTD